MKLPHFAIAGLVLLIAAGIYLTLQTDMDGKVEQLKADFERENQRRDRELKESVVRANAEAKAAADKARELAAAAAKEAPEPNPPLENLPQDPAVRNALTRVKSLVTPVPAPETADTIPDDPGAVPNPGILEKEEDIVNTARLEAERIARETAALNNLPTEVPEDKLSNLQSLIIAQPRIARVADARPGDNTDFIVLDEGSLKGLARGDRLAIRRGTAIVARIVIGDTVRENQCVANVVPRSLVTGMVIKPGDDIIKFDR